MEVTRKNFKESLPLVAKSIQTADFLVIDTEFTGLMYGPDVSRFGTPEEYYLTVLKGVSDFMLIQFGLCAFVWREKEQRYINEAYTFYVFPREKPGPDMFFLCQSSSLEFLSSQGFDFNKLIREGISYMTEPIEAKLREQLKERQKQHCNENKDRIKIPEENKQYIVEICNRVRTFIDENKSDVLEIDRCNAFVRRLLFQELARYKDRVLLETRVLENKDRVLKVTRIKSKDDASDRDALRKEKEREELEDAVGFSKVARMISQSGKLVVGHNMLLDVMHTLGHFFQPLPADYAAFKEFAHCMFPKLLDTKYMSSMPPFKDKIASSVLPHLYATMAEAPFALPDVGSEAGRGFSCADSKEHEAGYDAFITGLCFLAMERHLAGAGGRVTAGQGRGAKLRPLLNKLFLSKTAHQDSPFMNLEGSEPIPSRDHVFHLTFPREWQRNDINQLFSPFGPIVVQFLDDTSALVALARREKARDVALALSRMEDGKLTPYAQYKMAANGAGEARRREPHTCVFRLAAGALAAIFVVLFVNVVCFTYHF